MAKTPAGLVANARDLRKNATREEKHLWYDFLSKHPLRFRRQAPLGKYIVDFYCDSAKLAIELDGSQHFQGSGPEQDRARTGFLERVYSVRVLRFTNLDVKRNFEGVCGEIERVAKERLAPSVACGDSSPRGGA